MSIIELLALDFLAIQRSLASLEERFIALHESAEVRSKSLLKDIEEARGELSAKVDELEQVVVQRDVLLKENAEVRRFAEELKRQQQELRSEVKRLRDDAELTQLQLHQVQEELEHYFVLSLRQGEVLRDGAKLQEKSALLLSQVAE